MNHFKQYRPNYFTLDNPPIEFDFETAEELINHKIPQRFAVSHQDMEWGWFAVSIDSSSPRYMLMAVYNNGERWLVVGTLSDNVPDLPRWVHEDKNIPDDAPNVFTYGIKDNQTKIEFTDTHELLKHPYFKEYREREGFVGFFAHLYTSIYAVWLEDGYHQYSHTGGNTNRHIIDLPVLNWDELHLAPPKKTLPHIPHSQECADYIWQGAENDGFEVISCHPYKTENQFFAKGGTYYVLLVRGQYSEINKWRYEDDRFFQWGMGWYAPEADGCDGWATVPKYAGGGEDGNIQMTLILDKTSRPDLVEIFTTFH